MPTTSRATTSSSQIRARDHHGSRGDGRPRIESLATPGHSDDGVSFVVGGACFTGDTLFRDSVGGGSVDEVRRSVMDVLMALPHDPRPSRAYGRDDDRARVGREPVRPLLARARPRGRPLLPVAGEPATIVVWSPDYDGKGKALVRLDEGSEAIVGASRVELDSIPLGGILPRCSIGRSDERHHHLHRSGDPL